MNSRLQGVDIARGLALLGIITNHILFFTHPDLVESLQDYHAILFMLLAGIVFTYAEGSDSRLKNTVRGVICILLGLALGAGNPIVDVILLNYGWTFILGAFLVPKMNAKQLMVTAIFIVVFAPLVSYVVRGYTGTYDGDNIGFQTLLSQPWLVVTDPILYSHYPVLQWFGVFLFGAALGRMDIKKIVVSRRVFLYSLGVFLLAKTISIVGVWQGMRGEGFSLVDSVEKNFELGVGNVNPGRPWELLLSNPYASTTLALVSSTAAAVCIVVLCSWIALKLKMSWIALAGSATLTIYSVHVFIHTVIPLKTATDISVPYFLLTMLGVFAFVLFWNKVIKNKMKTPAPGPIEAFVSSVVAVEREKRSQAKEDA